MKTTALAFCLKPPIIDNCDFISLGSTALSNQGYSNCWNHPLWLKSSRNLNFRTKYFNFQDLTIPNDVIVGNSVIPEYAFLMELTCEIPNSQALFETLDYMYDIGDEDFLTRVRETNKKYNVADEEKVEWYLSFWGET